MDLGSRIRYISLFHFIVFSTDNALKKSIVRNPLSVFIVKFPYKFLNWRLTLPNTLEDFFTLFW